MTEYASSYDPVSRDVDGIRRQRQAAMAQPVVAPKNSSVAETITAPAEVPPRPKHRVLWGLGMAVGLVVLANVAVWGLYRGRAYPGIRIDKLAVGGLDRGRLYARLQGTTGSQNLILKNNDTDIALVDAGIDADIELTATAATEVFDAELPLVRLVHSVLSRPLELTYNVDGARLTTALQKIAAAVETPGRATGFTVRSGVLEVTPPQAGTKVNIVVTTQRILSALSAKQQIVPLVIEHQDFSLTGAQLATVKANAERLLTHKLSVVVDAKTIVMDRALLGDWISVSQTGSDTTVAFDQARVASYVAGLAAHNDHAAVGARVTITAEGNVTQAGQAGRAIDQQTLTTAMMAALTQEAPQTVTASWKAVAPGTTYIRPPVSYHGPLQDRLAQFAAGHSGIFGLDVKNLVTGETAAFNQEYSFTSASLYKLFVAKAIYQRVAGGQLTYGSASGVPGRNVDVCLSLMITISDNGCAEALAAKVGWMPGLDAEGYAGTDLTKIPKRTVAADVALLLERLYKNELLGPDETARFITLLKGQKVNNRLPVGLPNGTVIAHKTGDLGNYLHDAGIIWGPTGPYLVVAMSQGAHFSDFGELSSMLYSYFNP